MKKVVKPLKYTSAVAMFGPNEGMTSHREFRLIMSYIRAKNPGVIGGTSSTWHDMARDCVEHTP